MDTILKSSGLNNRCFSISIFNSAMIVFLCINLLISISTSTAYAESTSVIKKNAEFIRVSLKKQQPRAAYGLSFPMPGAGQYQTYDGLSFVMSEYVRSMMDTPASTESINRLDKILSSGHMIQLHNSEVGIDITFKEKIPGIQLTMHFL